MKPVPSPEPEFSEYNLGRGWWIFLGAVLVLCDVFWLGGMWVIMMVKEALNG